jgi:transporter family protein
MKPWMMPTFGAFVVWGLWSFIPKITVRYISPKSAVVYEVLGGILVAIAVLYSLNFRPDMHPKGVALGITTGLLGFLGALFFLFAVSAGYKYPPCSLYLTGTNHSQARSGNQFCFSGDVSRCELTNRSSSPLWSNVGRGASKKPLNFEGNLACLGGSCA